MKVLILHQHFKTPQTGGAIRSYYLARALASNGINVRVLTGYNGKKYYHELLDGIEVHYLPVAYDNRFGFHARSRSFLQFVTAILRRPKLLRDADVCYAISVPLTTGLPALWIQLRYNIPFIFEVGDLWPEAPVQLGYIKNPLLKWMLFRLEKTIYRKASAIVALSPAIKESVEKTAPGKIVHLIPNMADTEFYKPEEKRPDTEAKFSTGKFTVSYIGATGVANGLDYYLECARTAERAGLNIQFLLCGDGAMLDRLKKSAQQLSLKNLQFIPFQDRNGVREVMSVTDAVFICYKPVPVLETGSPNKYFDGLAAGKLIIVNFGGWIQKEIEENHCGIFTDPRHPTDFVKKIQPFLDSQKELEHARAAARKLAEEKYSRKILGDRFVRIFRTIQYS